MSNYVSKSITTGRTFVEFPSNECPTFLDAVRLAIELKIPLLLRSSHVTINSVLRLGSRQHLHIIGRHDEGSETTTTTTIIQGKVHSLFLLNNASRLTLDHVTLLHTLDPDDHRDVGAAINLRSKSQAEVRYSSIVSVAGFCVWTVQKTHIRMVDCTIYAMARSAIVCFGQSLCTLQQVTIHKAGVHALCARGACKIHLEECILRNNNVRAIYAYAQAQVELISCHIYQSQRPDKAAIEVVAANSSSSTSTSKLIVSSLTMRMCHVNDNAGIGVYLRGPVSYELQDNDISNNQGGNLVVHILEDSNDVEGDDGTSQTTTINRTTTATTTATTTKESTTIISYRRDETDSSFRKGDWWCPRCSHPKRVVMGRLTHCPTCGADKVMGGILLTQQQILQCNQQGLSSIIGRPTSVNTSRTTEVGAPSSTATAIAIASWWFDGGDEKGWLRYDDSSALCLERAYQQQQTRDDPLLVVVAGGRYQVNVQTMEQLNVETQMLRFVKRQMDLCT